MLKKLLSTGFSSSGNCLRDNMVYECNEYNQQYIDLVYLFRLLHCALASCGAVYCNRSCLRVCVQRAGGRAVSEPYYSQRARSVCVSLSAFSLFL